MRLFFFDTRGKADLRLENADVSPERAPKETLPGWGTESLNNSTADPSDLQDISSTAQILLFLFAWCIIDQNSKIEPSSP